MRQLTTRPVHPAIGVEVLGLDLSRPLDPHVAAELVALWEEHSLLVFRGQEVTPEQQLRLTACFGTVREVFFKDLAERKHNAETHPAIAFLSNIKVDGKPVGTSGDGELWFHSDHCYLEKSARASVLYGIETTTGGGDTLFASGYAAYAALPPEVKARLDGAMVEFVYDRELNAQERRHRPRPEHSQRAVHPAVVRHPGTGRPALFVNRLMATRILDMDEGESEALLDFLFDFQEGERFTYRHQWQPRDLLVWDNRSCIHARTPFDPAQRRNMRRTATEGEVLQAARLAIDTAAPT